MPIKPKYFDALASFGNTFPIAELHSRNHAEGVYLRHDVDHDLDAALELAFWENRKGIRSSYYLLHTAPYWLSNDFVVKCRQLVEFGHEVGLHINVLAEWYRAEIKDVAGRLRDCLEILRSAGADAKGIAAHGDGDCYRADFINYWLFADLRPNNPELKENGLSAEGVPAIGYSITYPKDHRLRRADGTEFPLWSLKLADFGLTYDAMHLAVDDYFSDSGGGWHRTRNPSTLDLSGRHVQITMHPEYWLDVPQAYVFMVSQPKMRRAVAELIKSATTLEVTRDPADCPNAYDEQLCGSEKTASHVADLLAARRKFETGSKSWAEVTTSGSWSPERIAEMFPDAVYVNVGDSKSAQPESQAKTIQMEAPGAVSGLEFLEAMSRRAGIAYFPQLARAHDRGLLEGAATVSDSRRTSARPAQTVQDAVFDGRSCYHLQSKKDFLSRDGHGSPTVSWSGCEVQRAGDELRVSALGKSNAYLLFGGGKWGSCSGKDGLDLSPQQIYRVNITLAAATGNVTLFSLQYDQEGRQLRRVAIGRLAHQRLTCEVSFRPTIFARRHKLALYTPSVHGPIEYSVAQCEIEQWVLNPVPGHPEHESGTFSWIARWCKTLKLRSSQKRLFSNC